MSVAPIRSMAATRLILPPQPVKCHRLGKRTTPSPRCWPQPSRTGGLGRPSHPRPSSTFRCHAFNFRRSGKPQHSDAAHREVVLFLAQRELESAFQRLVNMEMYEEARQVASQQEKLQEIVDEESVEGLDKAEGGGAGITATLFGRRQGSEAREEEKGEKYDDGDVVVKILSLRTDLQRAIDEEDYARASKVRDQILEIETAMDKQRQNAKPVVKREPKYSLGQCVVHWEDGWTGVVCGLQQERRKRKRKNVDERSSEEVEETVYTYHVLPDAKYWPKQRNTGPCVALVDEGDLNAPAPPATWRSVHGSDPENFLISHPYMYGLFLGQDGEGNYVPSKKLREKYKRERKDVYWSDGRGDSEDPFEN